MPYSDNFINIGFDIDSNELKGKILKCSCILNIKDKAQTTSNFRQLGISSNYQDLRIVEACRSNTQTIMNANNLTLKF